MASGDVSVMKAPPRLFSAVTTVVVFTANVSLMASVPLAFPWLEAPTTPACKKSGAPYVVVVPGPNLPTDDKTCVDNVVVLGSAATFTGTALETLEPNVPSPPYAAATE